MGYCLCDLYRLHLTDRQISQHCLRIKIHLYLMKPVCSIFIHFFMIDHLDRSNFFHREASQEQVLCHASCRNRLQLLMYHCDTKLHRLIRIVYLDLLSIHIYFSGIHLVDTEQTFHQCRFSRSVFPH